MPLFPPGTIVRDSDLVGGDGKLFKSRAALNYAREHFGFPLPRQLGGLNAELADVYNSWWDTRPREKRKLPEGMGGAQPRAGRPRKHPSPQPAA